MVLSAVSITIHNFAFAAHDRLLPWPLLGGLLVTLVIAPAVFLFLAPPSTPSGHSKAFEDGVSTISMSRRPPGAAPRTASFLALLPGAPAAPAMAGLVAGVAGAADARDQAADGTPA